MMPRQKKDFLLNPVVIIIIVIIAVISVFNFYQNTTKINQIETQISEIETQIAKEKAKNEKLEKQIKNSDDNEYIEEIAREKLGLVKPGEKLLIPVESENKNENQEKDKNDKKN
ncbi:Cell division protein DivIC (FtsB), stabilizes FtsL against RasP cleavage [Halanaerobium saccharolyticum subsp. saccharolyticum DSM 6643]|uniref:Cell division protein DivIC (FtsB), stabilizes FtsL against RasP cleavage n=2 Tax=Halanaerobium saccharolyticum TaxID=43595 RepID=M5DXH9_9FIRM|nr:Cell division protein DivIC (FtsB), stabilizes FtsL against RasP cleavage [Halanaerobium saccharolyticum subsp. saccharolyticum DSM 6643]